MVLSFELHSRAFQKNLLINILSFYNLSYEISVITASTLINDINNFEGF